MVEKENILARRLTEKLSLGISEQDLNLILSHDTLGVRCVELMAAECKKFRTILSTYLGNATQPNYTQETLEKEADRISALISTTHNLQVRSRKWLYRFIFAALSLKAAGTKLTIAEIAEKTRISRQAAYQFFGQHPEITFEKLLEHLP